MINVDDIREIFIGKVNGSTEISYHSTSCPVTKADRYTIGIIIFKLFDIFFILYNIRPKLFFERWFHVRYAMKCCQNNEANVVIKSRPQKLLKFIRILLLPC